VKALVLTAPSTFELQDVPAPDVPPGHVRIRVAACGICGSDVHGMDGSSGRRQPPIIMGHEAAGVIDRVAPDVRDWRPGDRVTFDSTVYCGHCAYCRAGRVNLCDDRRVLGVSCGDYRQHGAFAEFVAVPRHILYRVPDAVSLEHAAMVEPVSVAVHAVRRVPDAFGKTAVVVGAGMIGLLVVQAAKAAGYGRVLAVDVDEGRLALARNLGADDAIPAGEDARARIRDATDGQGADVAFEAVGIADTVATAVEATRKGGGVVLVGNLAPGVPLPLQSVVTRELTLHGSCASAGEYPLCLDLMARGAVRVAPLLSACAPLEEGAGWFRRLHAREPGLMKIILQPQGADA
jgi:L-iditol 2-dehydrogenase